MDSQHPVLGLLSAESGLGLVEVLMVIIVLGLLMVAAAPMANTTSRSVKQTTDRAESLAAARIGFERMTRDIRSGKTIAWANPTIVSTVGDANDLQFTTNRITVERIMPGQGPDPIPVLFECGWNSGAGAPECKSSYQPAGGGPTVTTWYLRPGMTGSTRVELYNPTGANPATSGGTNEAFKTFRLRRMSEPDPASAYHRTYPDNVELRWLVCVGSQRCSEPGANEPVEMKTSISPRNLRPLTECEINPDLPECVAEGEDDEE